MASQVLGQEPITPEILTLPKADFHLHQEIQARLDRVLARREGRAPHDWHQSVRKVLIETAPGFGRLRSIYAPDADLPPASMRDLGPDTFVDCVTDILEEGAADGAVLVEVQFGGTQIADPVELMTLFRTAERRVQRQYPQLRAEALAWLNPVSDPVRLASEERRLEACLAGARAGLSGVNFRVDPYETEADPALWSVVDRWAERAREAGLGIAIHAGEFSAANLAAALRVPGLSRVGHAVYAASSPPLLEQLAASGVAVECSLTCNVVLGAVSSYETHPIRTFVTHGIPVTLNTDLPVHVCTTIGREYALAAALGFSLTDLRAFTANAVRASFTSPERRNALLTELNTAG